MTAGPSNPSTARTAVILAVLGSLSACGGSDDDPPPAKQMPNAAEACATLSGKTIGGLVPARAVLLHGAHDDPIQIASNRLAQSLGIRLSPGRNGRQ